MMIYYSGDEWEGSTNTKPFYYESTEAALVHFMENVRQSQELHLKYCSDYQKWQEEFDLLRGMKESDKKNQKWNELWARRPTEDHTSFKFAGLTFNYQDFLSEQKASATSKAKMVDNPPEILTVDEYFERYAQKVS